MGRGKILTIEEELKIIEGYKSADVGIEFLGSKFGVGKLKIKDVLDKHNVPIKGKGAQVREGNTDEITKAKSIIYKASEGKKLVAVCKLYGTRFSNVNNECGILTQHIINNYGEVIPIPSNIYQSKKYELKHGKRWYEEYFDIIEEDADKTRECKVCGWTTTDFDNKTGCFENHLIKAHSMQINDYLLKFPDDTVFHKTIIRRKAKDEFLNKKANSVECKICGKKMSFINSGHLRSHGINLLEYKIRFPNEKIISDLYSSRISTNYVNGLGKHERKFTSTPHKEIISFLESYNVVVKSNDRKILDKLEIDILLPELKIGIEFNGLYYHTERMGKGRNYHIFKTKEMNSNGYKLIQIFEDEWIDNKNLVLNKIKHLIGVNESKIIGGRKCVIREITTNEKKDFLNINHIQQSDMSKIAMGAFYNDTLISVMSFDNNRSMTDKNNDVNCYDLTRFATDINYKIPGIANRLLNFFIKTYNPEKIISFGDRRWVLDGSSNMYTKLGFSLVNILRPNYYYFKSSVSRCKRLHKFSFGKSSLKKKFPEIYSDDKTEWGMMQEAGFDRIWDCGLFKYELKCR